MSDSVGKYCPQSIFPLSFTTGNTDSRSLTDRVFVHALNTVKRIPRTGSARPPPSDRLKLYGLYKQSMEGNVEGVMKRPEGHGQEAAAEQEKWYVLIILLSSNISKGIHLNQRAFSWLT